MDDRPVSYRHCQACTARILWVLTPAGRRMPLDEQPTEDGTGNVVIEHVGGQTRGRVLTGAEMPSQGPAYVPHHRTCPAAAEFRRRHDITVPRCGGCREPLDEWLVEHGYTRHVGCMPVHRPASVRTPPPAPPAPVVHEQAELDLGGAL